MRNIYGYLGITALLVAGAVAAWMYVKTGDEPTPAVWSGGEIRVGYSSEPPYAYREADGTVTGDAPDTARTVLSRLGINRVRWVLMDFSQAIAELLAGRIDLIANGMFITPDRAARIAFSLPYAQVAQGLLVRAGNPRDLHAYEEAAARADVRIAVLDGSVEQEALRRMGMAEDRLFVVPEPMDGLAAVRLGRADGLALSAPTVAWLAREGGSEVAVAWPFHQPGSLAVGLCAFGLRRQDGRLRQALDGALRDYIGSPEHLERVSRFGFGPDTVPDWARR